MKKIVIYFLIPILTILLFNIISEMPAKGAAHWDCHILEVTRNDVDIIVNVGGGDAGCASSMGLCSPRQQPLPPGETNLGKFPVGTELIFYINACNSGTYYFTGPADRNPDGICHARFYDDWIWHDPSIWRVSFEDQYGGGDWDFNDLFFTVTGGGSWNPNRTHGIWLKAIGGCNSSDGWYNKGNTYSCCNGSNKCTCQDQEYREYYWSACSCTSSVTGTQTLKSDCNTCDEDYCEAWGANYCKSGDIYHKRTCHNSGCSEGDCYDNTYVQEELVTDCSYGCKNGVCLIPPIANANGPYTGNEGSAITFDGSNSSDSDGTITYEWDFDGDGQYDDGTGISPLYTWGDDYSGTIGLKVTDNDGLTDTDTTEVTVLNVNPIVTAGDDQSVNEGETVIFNGSINDPGNDTHTFVWDFGDGTSTTSAGLTPTHVYADNGTYTVILTVTDDNNGVGTDELTVTVENVTPTVVAGPNQTVNEGEIVSLSPSTFNDLGTLDYHTATIDWGDDTTPDIGLISEAPFGPPGSIAGADGTVFGSHIYGDNGTYTVTVEVVDDESAKGSDTLTVNVNNINPTASIDSVGQPYPEFILPYHELIFSGSFTDPGWLDTHSSKWNFGDGIIEEKEVTEEHNFPDATGTAIALHAYLDPGEYTITLTITDDDMGEVSDSVSVHVMNSEEATQAFIDYIQNLPDDAFDKDPVTAKAAFNNKLNEILDNISQGSIQDALNQLINDILGKADGSLFGNENNDWIIDYVNGEDVQQVIYQLVRGWIYTLLGPELGSINEYIHNLPSSAFAREDKAYETKKNITRDLGNVAQNVLDGNTQEAESQLQDIKNQISTDIIDPQAQQYLFSHIDAYIAGL